MKPARTRIRALVCGALIAIGGLIAIPAPASAEVVAPRDPATGVATGRR